jgi:hypothetical protein
LCASARARESCALIGCGLAVKGRRQRFTNGRHSDICARSCCATHGAASSIAAAPCSSTPCGSPSARSTPASLTQDLAYSKTGEQAQSKNRSFHKTYYLHFGNSRKTDR